MTEKIDTKKKLQTRESLIEDMRSIGIEKGMTLIVHSSLSSIGWVSGGAVNVILALMDAVTEEGTLIMPTQTPMLSDPYEWNDPPVPEEWHARLKADMPGYHPAYSPSSGMGVIPETFRTFQSVRRSSHPAVSFAAWGKNKDFFMEDHPYDFALGESSPLGKLYKSGAYVLLLGVEFDSNTSFHLAEYRITYQDKIKTSHPIIENEKTIWKAREDLEFREELFEELGAAFEKEEDVGFGKIGSAHIRLFKMEDSVDFAVRWFKQKDKKANKKQQKRRQ